jgi:transposase-like protein
MPRIKGSKATRPNRYWSKEAKYEYVQLILSGEASMTQIGKDNDISVGQMSTWVKRYQEGGIEALENKRKPGNPLSKYQNKKELTELEQLQYENMKLKIENLRLKKGYTTEEVMAIRQKRRLGKNTK